MSSVKPVDYQKYKEYIPEFREKSEDFFTGKMNIKEYKGFSGKYGSYAQRGGKNSMLRLRMNAGRLTPEKLAMVTAMADKHQVNPIHMTTCQTVQFHNLNLDAVCDIMDHALDAGVVWYGGGGDYPRNVMASPLSGTEEEYFDVMPYADVTANFLLDFIDAEKMPRKLKVGFSNNEKNTVHATFRDLGFVAKENGNFDVYCCGGLGKDPKFGVEVAENVKPDQILYYVEAMIRMFRKLGNYENRAKARTRFIQDSHSAEEIRREFDACLQAVRLEKDLTLTDEDLVFAEVKKEGKGEELEESFLVRKQKQPGLYTVAYHPRGGITARETLDALNQAISNMQDVEIRLSPDEGSYIINLTADEAREILQIIDAETAHNAFETSMACIGASICQVGLRDSQSTLQKALDAVKAEEGIADNALPQIHISGCPSSCGTHQTAPIGFRGGLKVIDKKPVAAYALYLGGNDLQGHETMGQEAGMIAETEVPAFLAALGKAVSQSGLSYEEWVKENPDGTKEIAEAFFL